MTRLTIGSTCWKDIDGVLYGALGSAVAGGYLICKSGGTAWIVSPSSTEVSRIWNSRNDAVTTAQASAACGDWFVPTKEQLLNPGYTCRTYWDSYSSAVYWSSTEIYVGDACIVCFYTGTAGTCNNSNTFCVRAFRCVTY